MCQATMDRVRLYFLLLLLVDFSHSLDKGKQNINIQTLTPLVADNTVTVYGVTGGTVELPCNTSAVSKENYPMLVMWFKDDNLNPFYRYCKLWPRRGFIFPKFSASMYFFTIREKM